MAHLESFSGRESAQANPAAMHRRLRRHKALPHPQQSDRAWEPRTSSQPFVNAAASAPLIHDLHQLSSLSDLRHELPRTGTGPDPPPTPPIQSRASSSRHSSRHSVASARTTSPAVTDGGAQLASPATIQRPLATPPDQRSPPTPDVTPPLRVLAGVERGTHQSYASGMTMRRRTGSPEGTYTRKPRHAPSAPLKPTRPESQDTTTVQRTASAPSKPTKKSDTQTVVRSRKYSNASSNSTSNVVEVLLVDEPPQRQRTLRHVRKHSALRDPLIKDQDSAEDRIELKQSPRPPQTAYKRLSDANSRRESVVSIKSNHTSRSISSNRDRREIRNSGAVPVVIVPERTSSHGYQSREPSLKSASSKKSRRTTSVISAPLRDSQTSFERQGRRSRRYSELESYDWKAFGSPPAIPPRSSSLSAPTSRNVSRASSMRTRSIKTNSFRTDEGRQSQSRPVSPPISDQGARPWQEIPSISLSPQLDEEPWFLHGLAPGLFDRHDSLVLDPYDETLSLRRLPSFDTPFSVLSMETCATLPELSEALAVHMYHHQNSSVLVVENAGRPSTMQTVQEKKQRNSEPPRSARTYATEIRSATPPAQTRKLQDAYSPLRNPRVPPRPPRGPPAFNSKSATPSGKTPAHERLAHRATYSESLKERPPRQLDIVKRALSRRRRHSVDFVSTTTDKPRGFLTRTFSLSRSTRKGVEEDKGDLEKSTYADFPRIDDAPFTAKRLHASWQPQHTSQRQDDVLEDGDSRGSLDSDFDAFDYPPVDNRPPRPTRRRRRRRSRSHSAAADFSLPTLPAWDFNMADDVFRPESQNGSPAAGEDLHSLREESSPEIFWRSPRTSLVKQTPPISQQTRGVWRSKSVDTARRIKRRFSVGDTLEDIQNIPQMLREKRREKRSQKLRLMISGPKEVRDGVGEVIRRGRAEDYRPAMVTHI